MAVTTAAVVSGVAGAYSAVKGAKGAGSGSQTQKIPKWQQDQIQKGYNLTNAAAARSADQAVAGFNGDQTGAFNQVRANQGMGYADYDQAIANAKGLTGTVGLDLGQFQNPYDSQV